MRINLTPKKRGGRLAGAAVAVSALAVILGLTGPAASARTVARTGPAAVAAPGSSTCHWLPDAVPGLGHRPSDSSFPSLG